MAVLFHPKNHSYESVDLFEKIKWMGVTTLVGKYKAPFDAKAQALKSSQNKKSKWYGISPVEIIRIWEGESLRSTTLGSWYHDKEEETLLSNKVINLYGAEYKVQPPIYNSEKIKVAPEQKLIPGTIYPEHFVYLKSVGVCGQSDRVECTYDNILNIRDYKTSKEIATSGYVNWEGLSKRMLPPLYHLDECEYNSYNLQLSVYAYIICKHNPLLKVGDLIIEHIIFEEAGRDKYDYPITLLDKKGEPIIKEIVPYKMPYLKTEVELIFNHFKAA